MSQTVTLKRPNDRKSARRYRNTRKRAQECVVASREYMIARAIPLEDLPDVDPTETMQLLINRTERLWRYAAAQVDALRPGIATNQSGESMDHELWPSWDDNGNLVVQHNYWVEREKQLAELLGKLTESAQKLGLAERRTRVAEGQVQLLGEALKAACVAAGITGEQQKQLGAALRTELATIEGTAIEIAA